MAEKKKILIIDSDPDRSEQKKHILRKSLGGYQDEDFIIISRLQDIESEVKQNGGEVLVISEAQFPEHDDHLVALTLNLLVSEYPNSFFCFFSDYENTSFEAISGHPLGTFRINGKEISLLIEQIERRLRRPND